MGVGGRFHLLGMAHTADWPDGKDVAPWDGESQGDYIYRAIPCSGNAPVNNLSSNLPSYNSLIPGSRSPASTRSHPFRFKVTNNRMSGSIDLTVCKLAPGPTDDATADADRDRIRISFQADSNRQAAGEVVFSGSFSITGGTGRYLQLSGEGSIQGSFMCLHLSGEVDTAPPIMLRDLQFALLGTFADPAFDPAGENRRFNRSAST